MILVLIIVALVGFLNAVVFRGFFQALVIAQGSFAIRAARLGFLLGVKIILLALFFYYVLHHAKLNFILVLITFFVFNWLGMKKAILHGKS